MRIRLAALLLSVAAAAPCLAFELQSHRGGRGLWPENSLTAFAGSLGLGVSVLELDTGITADGAVVVHHDPALNPEIARGRDGRWISAPGPLLRQLTLEQIQSYDIGRADPTSRYPARHPALQPVDGERVPTLDAVFALAARSGNGQVRFNIETKLSPARPDDTASPELFAERLLAVIHTAGMEERVTIQSFDWRTLRLVQQAAPGIPTVYLSAQQRFLDNIQAASPGASAWTAGIAAADHGGSVPRMVKAAGGRVWSPFYRDPTDDDIATARRLGLQVVVWTVNDRAEMAGLLDRGIDGIITDRPDILRALMAERGMAQPTATPVAH
ncbi:glycerophosphoryl diester phosphodiesterase [Stella humosa]|uniref:Glycerophosphoryl diester phosphodiesterase n=1 Tax=Stella humosa TaxID=94 RepID=A0A3N1MCI3_9PROT|nr:glycerophosphodiester phosphodiesterase [Stella humosa]ROQ01308.1 glycerophosphoryl diester phosphodiesterase [Stella humosa]BBK31682.1 glycerophosphoryl diester phosphodiesterase [Stella humosa]